MKKIIIILSLAISVSLVISVIFKFITTNNKSVSSDESYAVTFMTFDRIYAIKILKLPSTTIDTLPDNPESGGLIFDGWYTEPYSGGTEFNNSTVVTADIIVHARWSTNQLPPSARVTFDSNGGSKVPEQIVIYGDKLIEPNPPTKEGFIFDGWYTDKELMTAYDFDEIFLISFTLYAKWI